MNWLLLKPFILLMFWSKLFAVTYVVVMTVVGLNTYLTITICEIGTMKIPISIGLSSEQGDGPFAFIGLVEEHQIQHECSMGGPRSCFRH